MSHNDKNPQPHQSPVHDPREAEPGWTHWLLTTDRIALLQNRQPPARNLRHLAV